MNLAQSVMYFWSKAFLMSLKKQQLHTSFICKPDPMQGYGLGK